MKKLSYFAMLLALLCCIVCLVACANDADVPDACPNDPEHVFSAALVTCPDPDAEGEMIYTCVNCGMSYAEAIPRAASGEIDLTIDPEGMTRSYNALRTTWPSYYTKIDGNIVDAQVEFSLYELREGVYQRITELPVDAGSYRIVGEAYYESGELADSDTVDFTILPAAFPFVESDTFPYTGASFFEALPIKACGEDMIGYTVYFEHGNAGAPIMEIVLSGEKAHNYAIHEDYTAAIVPKTVDISTLTDVVASKAYDATGTLTLNWSHAELDGILDTDGEVAVSVNTAQIDVCDAIATTMTAQRSACGNYRFTGSASLILTITPAVFTPPTTFVYNGDSAMSATVATGLGGDTVTYRVAFESKNVGAAMVENGVSLEGAKAGNYVLPAAYTAQILPKPVDLSSLEGMELTKDFDGTDLLLLTLRGESCSLIPDGETVTIEGNVGQIRPCNDMFVLFTPNGGGETGNYAFESSFGIYLTVNKAKLQLSGTCELPYTGSAVMPLPYDAAYASGRVTGYPVWMRVHFASKNVGADVMEITVLGENADCYELIAQDLDCQIVPKTVRLTSGTIKYPYNGTGERVEIAGKSYRMLNFRSADDVSAVLRFESAECGAQLQEIELIGADALNYELDTSNFTASIVEVRGEAVVVENLQALSNAVFHPGRVLDPIYTPVRAVVGYYLVNGDDVEPLSEKPNEPGSYRVVILCEGGVGQADSSAEYDFSIVAHDHVEDVESYVPAICETAGVRVFRCACGDSYEEPISAPGHMYELIDVEREGCAMVGMGHYKCACGAQKDEEVPAGHIYTEYGCCRYCTNYLGNVLGDQSREYTLAAGESAYRMKELGAGTYTVTATAGEVKVVLFDGVNYTPSETTFTVTSVVACYIAITNTSDEPISGSVAV